MDDYTDQWLNQYAGQLALIGFEGCLKHGKGIIDAKVLPGLNPKLNYVVGNAPDYDPNSQVVIRINNQDVQLCNHNVDMRAFHGRLMMQ
ncbi:MAG: hypothetical protein AAGD25_29285 [Cyanobacteria bacterium P01_F01_bin.150]